MTQLLKVPFLLSILVCVHITMTPPTNEPPKNEQMKPKGLERFAPWFPYVAKSIIWALSLCEITTVLLMHHVKDDPTPSQFASILTFSAPSRALNITMTPVFLFGWAINFIGTLFRVRCYRILGERFTFELSIRKNHRLVTSGPYALVRHPSYSGAILAGVGTIIAHLTRGSWVMECLDLHAMGIQRRWICLGAICLATSALVPRMNKEDRMLREHFGREWDRWKETVPYRLFPGVY